MPKKPSVSMFVMAALAGFLWTCFPSVAQGTGDAASGRRPNMVSNGSFESGSNGWRLGPLSKVDATGLLTVDDPGRAVGSDTYSAPIPVDPAMLYRLTAKIRYEGDRTALMYVRSYKGGTQVGRQRAILGTGDRPPGQWHTVSARFRPRRDADTIRLWIHSSSGATGAYSLDDIRLRHPYSAEDKMTLFLRDGEFRRHHFVSHGQVRPGISCLCFVQVPTESFDSAVDRGC